VSGRFLALDAGNSKTVAVVVDGDGAALGRGRGGRGDIYNAPTPDHAAQAVLSAARAALAEAGASPGELDAAAFRLAGVDWPEDAPWWRDRIEAGLAGLSRFSVANDGFASLRLGALDGVGLAITIGTGPAIAARSREGREACSGWWVFDNLGGWGLAEGAIRATCLAWMGLAEPTVLADALCRLFDVPDPYALRHQLTRRDRKLPADAELRATRTVLDVARSGDPVASRLVAEQAAAFARYAGWVAEQVGARPGPDLPVVLNGSIATSENPVLREALIAALRARYPECAPAVAAGPPLAGCVLDAYAEGGVALTPELARRTVELMHPPEFLDT